MIDIGYIILSVLMSLILIRGYHFGLRTLSIDEKSIAKKTAYVATGLILWFVYIFAMSHSGILHNFDFPPRFPLFLILPAFVFTGVVLYRNRNSAMLSAIPQSWAIYYQTFRIFIESLFVASVAQGILHREVTIKGYNFDMLFAFTAPIVGYMVFSTMKLPKKLALTWNYIGLLVIGSIIFLFVTTIFIPSFWGSETTLASLEIMDFPFVLVPAFLMPSAVFVHIFSILQLYKQ